MASTAPMPTSRGSIRPGEERGRIEPRLVGIGAVLDALTHEGGPPAFSLPAQGDQMAGMNLFAAISMALLHRERTGEGSEVSTSLHAGGLWSNAMLAQGALLNAYVTSRPPRT